MSKVGRLDIEGAAEERWLKRGRGRWKEKGFGEQGLWLGLDSRTGLDGGE